MLSQVSKQAQQSVCSGWAVRWPFLLSSWEQRVEHPRRLEGVRQRSIREIQLGQVWRKKDMGLWTRRVRTKRASRPDFRSPVHGLSARLMQGCFPMGHPRRSHVPRSNERSQSQHRWLHDDSWCSPQRRKLDHPSSKESVLCLLSHSRSKNPRTNVSLWDPMRGLSSRHHLLMHHPEKRSCPRRRANPRNSSGSHQSLPTSRRVIWLHPIPEKLNWRKSFPIVRLWSLASYQHRPHGSWVKGRCLSRDNQEEKRSPRRYPWSQVIPWQALTKLSQSLAN
jgi:hypothetical protein